MPCRTRTRRTFQFKGIQSDKIQSVPHFKTQHNQAVKNNFVGNSNYRIFKILNILLKTVNYPQIGQVEFVETIVYRILYLK